MGADEISLIGANFFQHLTVSGLDRGLPVINPTSYLPGLNLVIKALPDEDKVQVIDQDDTDTRAIRTSA